MLYPANIEEKIGFIKIKEKLTKKCEGEYGKAFINKIKFSSEFETISTLTNQVDEFLKIIQSQESFPGGNYFNIDKYLLKASKFDAYLLCEEFHELKLTLNNVSDILKFFKKRNEEYHQLSLLIVGVYLNPDILHKINKVVDERGNLRNSASEDLLRIRNKLHNIQSKVRGKLEQILKKFASEGYSNDDASITIRNGRLVIPVRAEFKRVVGGFIHDESATGQTAFIEPSSLVEINNDVRDLMHQEKREIIRILTALTDSLRPELKNIHSCSAFLGTIDFIRAKARFALDINGVLPEIQNSVLIDWQEARHPLLFLSYKDSDKNVVPVNIFLSDRERILVISGPNAGGKSVCLQTVGLIQYMFQCGLLVPMYEGSTMGIFQQLFIDIGDEQSIENDLSTYSSHLVNMNYFIQHANRKTLFLIDEFGTGTEPQFGGAIAESILDQLRNKKSFGLITTHYTNLKKYAENHEGIVNGAMRFDIEKMEALFELVIGKPGSSFALEIAEKIGLPGELIRQAKKNIGATHVKFERLLGELEQEKKRI
jgi:DNA mismatch repair protein MutS2